MDDETQYIVQYVAGPYSGERVVWARDPNHAEDVVRAWVRRTMTLPMYADSYRVRDAGGQP